MKTHIINIYMAGINKVLARCYVVAKVYEVPHICDTDPPCKVYVHIFTIILFLSARVNTVFYLI